MTAATQTKADPADLEAVKDFPARAARAMSEILEMIEISDRLEKAGYPSGSALLCAVSATETLPAQVDYINEVAEQVRIAQICGWDLGARRWWFNRIEDHGTIDGCRMELEDTEALPAFESFNRHFEAEYPELALKLSIAIDKIHNAHHQASGEKLLRELKPQLEVALRVVVGGRHQGRLTD